MAKTIFNMADGILTPCTCSVARSWHWFRQVTAPCNVACDSGIMIANSPSGSRHTLQPDMLLWGDMSLNSPGGSTPQCGRWLRDDMPLNSPKRPPYWNSTSGFAFDHITTVWHVIQYQSAKFLSKSDHPRQNKMTSCRFSRWRISTILDFRGSIMGSLKSQCTTSYRLSTETIAINCLVFEKIAFFAYWWQTDKQTERQTDGQAHRIKPRSLASGGLIKALTIRLFNMRDSIGVIEMGL